MIGQSRTEQDPGEIGGLRRSFRGLVRKIVVGDRMVKDPLETSGTRLFPKSIGTRVLAFDRKRPIIFDKGPALAVVPVSRACRRICVEEYISASKKRRYFIFSRESCYMMQLCGEDSFEILVEV